MTRQMLLDLTKTASVRIQRVSSDDAHRRSDSLQLLTERLLGHQHLYPDIDCWIRKKVIPDLRTCRRTGFIGYVDETPVLTAVMKFGVKTKFCHVSVDDGFQGGMLGHLVFSLMAFEARSFAKEIHFTLPQALWQREKTFFGRFGFNAAERSRMQYRLFDEELRCSAPFSLVWNQIVSQLPSLLTSYAVSGFRVNDGVVLSVSDKHARSIMEGKKTVEIRRRFNERWVGRDASVYAAGRSRSLLGNVTISNVVKADPTEIWDRFSNEMGCSREEFDEYSESKTVLYAILLANPRPYQSPVPLSQLSHLLGEKLSAPQSYATHSHGDLWSRALSIASALHGNIEPTRGLDHADYFRDQREASSTPLFTLSR